MFGLLLIVFTLGGSFLGVLLGYEYNLPPIQSLEDYQPDVITGVYSDDNKIIGEFAIERRVVVSHDEIPPYLQLAIVAVEDGQFYNHSGINYFAIIRAVTKDFIRQSYPLGKGASTITQQLARMLINRYEKTWDRKIKEILIAWKIEKQYSKQQILTLYANIHMMAPGIYGVAATADYYFGKQLKDLTLEECALIAGLPNNPVEFSPRLHPKAALRRRNFILDRMVKEGMIPAKMAAEAKAKPIVLKPESRDTTELAPYFVERVRQYLAARYSTNEIWRKGMRVYTTLNIDMQRAAQNALRNGLRSYDKKRGWRGPIENILDSATQSLESYKHSSWRKPLHPEDIVVGLVEEIDGGEAVVRIGDYHGHIGRKEIAWTKARSPQKILKPGDLAYFKIVSMDDVHKTLTLLLEQRPKVNGAIIIIENKTGEIKAMVGGYDFEASEFNRATQAKRQVGSTFKPLVYSTAFEKGMTPDDTVLDTPFIYLDELGRVYEPKNYDEEYKGEITIRQALTESRNVPTVKVAKIVGIDNLVLMARRFGISGTLHPYLSLALGAFEASPLEMASAFTVFPNLGTQAKPYFIRRVEDYDHVIKEENSPQTHSVLRPEIAAETLDLLQNVVQDDNGTGRAARVLGRPVGGKTGTTDDFTDAWFVGFSPSLTAAVWVGLDQKKTLGSKQSGSVVALPIWIECFREILKDKPIEHFPSMRLTDQISGGSPDSESKHIFVEDLRQSTATENSGNNRQK